MPESLVRSATLVRGTGGRRQLAARVLQLVAKIRYPGIAELNGVVQPVEPQRTSLYYLIEQLSIAKWRKICGF